MKYILNRQDARKNKINRIHRIKNRINRIFISKIFNPDNSVRNRIGRPKAARRVRARDGAHQNPEESC